MTTPRPQPSRHQTPATKDNPSYANLRKELEQNAELLKYLPFNRATFQPQIELYGAASHRLLYGDMMEEKNQIWIYFTMLGGGHNYCKGTGGTRMISFHTLKGAQNGSEAMHPKDVQKAALAAGAFKLAQNHLQAIAKYFFIKRGVDDHLETPLKADNFKDALVRACKEYKMAFEKIEAKKKVVAQAVATVGRYGGTTSRDRETSRPATSLRSTSYTGIPTGPAADRPATQPRPSAPSRKRSLSPSPRYTPAHPDTHSPPPAAAQISASLPSRPTSQQRDAMMDKYIALQTQEEDLGRQICTAESERSDITAQMVGLQAHLDEAEGNKAELMRKQYNVRAEKKRLQAPMESEEQLEFGFEAGRKMECKRLRRE